MLITALRSLSVETIEPAKTNPTSYLILPVQGRYTLTSSALAGDSLRVALAAQKVTFHPGSGVRAGGHKSY
jgi:hypothetical protein